MSETIEERAKKELARMCEGTGFTGAKGELWRCLHHRKLLEFATDPVLDRIIYVLRHKPENEHGVRLQEMKPWLGKVPKNLAKAWDDYYKAWADCDKAWADYDNAGADCDNAWDDYYKALADCDNAWADYDKARADYYEAAIAQDKRLNPGSAWDYENSVIRGTEGTK